MSNTTTTTVGQPLVVDMTTDAGTVSTEAVVILSVAVGVFLLILCGLFMLKRNSSMANHIGRVRMSVILSEMGSKRRQRTTTDVPDALRGLERFPPTPAYYSESGRLVASGGHVQHHSVLDGQMGVLPPDPGPPPQIDRLKRRQESTASQYSQFVRAPMPVRSFMAAEIGDGTLHENQKEMPPLLEAGHTGDKLGVTYSGRGGRNSADMGDMPGDPASPYSAGLSNGSTPAVRPFNALQPMIGDEDVIDEEEEIINYGPYHAHLHLHNGQHSSRRSSPRRRRHQKLYNNGPPGQSFSRRTPNGLGPPNGHFKRDRVHSSSVIYLDDDGVPRRYHESPRRYPQEQRRLVAYDDQVLLVGQESPTRRQEGYDPSVLIPQSSPTRRRTRTHQQQISHNPRGDHMFFPNNRASPRLAHDRHTYTNGMSHPSPGRENRAGVLRPRDDLDEDEEAELEEAAEELEMDEEDAHQSIPRRLHQRNRHRQLMPRGESSGTDEALETEEETGETETGETETNDFSEEEDEDRTEWTRQTQTNDFSNMRPNPLHEVLPPPDKNEMAYMFGNNKPRAAGSSTGGVPVLSESNQPPSLYDDTEMSGDSTETMESGVTGGLAQVVEMGSPDFQREREAARLRNRGKRHRRHHNSVHQRRRPEPSRASETRTNSNSEDQEEELERRHPAFDEHSLGATLTHTQYTHPPVDRSSRSSSDDTLARAAHQLGGPSPHRKTGGASRAERLEDPKHRRPSFDADEGGDQYVEHLEHSVGLEMDHLDEHLDPGHPHHRDDEPTFSRSRHSGHHE